METQSLFRCNPPLHQNRHTDPLTMQSTFLHRPANREELYTAHSDLCHKCHRNENFFMFLDSREAQQSFIYVTHLYLPHIKVLFGIGGFKLNPQCLAGHKVPGALLSKIRKAQQAISVLEFVGKA